MEMDRNCPAFEVLWFAREGEHFVRKKSDQGQLRIIPDLCGVFANRKGEQNLNVLFFALRRV